MYNAIPRRFHVKQIQVGERCQWEDLEIGEVFAVESCWVVACKMSLTTALILSSDDWAIQDNFDGKVVHRNRFPLCNGLSEPHPIYRLPKSAQDLWREE